MLILGNNIIGYYVLWHCAQTVPVVFDSSEWQPISKQALFLAPKNSLESWCPWGIASTEAMMSTISKCARLATLARRRWTLKAMRKQPRTHNPFRFCSKFLPWQRPLCPSHRTSSMPIAPCRKVAHPLWRVLQLTGWQPINCVHRLWPLQLSLKPARRDTYSLLACEQTSTQCVN